MKNHQQVRILLVDDDEEDQLIVRKLLSERWEGHYHLDWVKTYQSGLEAARLGRHDVLLLDYQLMEGTGLEFLREILAQGCQLPVILVTGQRDPDLDLQAIRAGASDFLSKEGLVAAQLTRSIRCSIERRMAELERAQLLNKLHQTQRLETIATLAGGISHDFNNSLGIILGFSEMVLNQSEQSKENRARLEYIMDAANRAKVLVEQIMTFSRQGKYKRRSVQMHVIVKEALRLIRHSIPSEVDVLQNIDAHSGAIVSDSTEIHQIVVNLVTNATQAMRKNGGILEVGLERINIDAKLLRMNPNLRRGSYLCLSVRDTGTGMDRVHVDKVFDPFYTTRGRGEGLGLGLSVVHGIVASHGGEIMVHSGPGEGTLVQVYLPQPDSDEVHESFLPEPKPEGKERIMVVDDEVGLAIMAKGMLNFLGYDVIMKTTSQDAIQTFRRKPDAFDVVIIDQAMPRITGTQLAGELLRIRPTLPIILTTAYSDSVTMENYKEYGIRGFIPKPFVASELGQAIRRVL